METQVQQLSPQITFDTMLTAQLAALTNMAKRFVREQEQIEDLVQDTLLKALRFRHRFSVDTNIKGWLYTIMRNTFINSAKKVLKGRELEQGLEKKYDEKFTFNTVFSELTTADIQQAMGKLSPALRQPINLYSAGYRYDEISQIIGCPLGTIKTRIRAARMQLSRSCASYLP